MKKISLNGPWEYRLPGPAKKRWGRMTLPCNWETGGLINYRGKVLFRKHFTFNKLLKGKSYWLIFHGVDYRARVTLNGKLLGVHTGYFQTFDFRINRYLREGPNTLIVEVDSGPERNRDWPENKKSIKGVFGHHDIRPGSWHPRYGQNHGTGGIWNNIVIEETGPIRIRQALVTPKLSADYTRARVSVRITIQKGAKQYSFTKIITINKPRLWWTQDQGQPQLYRITVTAGTESKEVVFGIREVKFDKDENLFLNGRRIFIRGTNIIPEEYLSQYTPDRIAGDIQLALNANINALRLHAHVNRPEFYSACDRAGILVWQDFPLQWEYSNTNSFINDACRQCRDMVTQLYNHPSIFLWCCHNEPLKSKKRLDPRLAREVSQIDKTRIIMQSSDFDRHPYPGWFVGKMEYFNSLPGCPLVTEFGAQALPSLPSLKKIIPSQSLWPPDWQKWSYYNFVYDQTFHNSPVRKGKTLRAFIANSQSYQVELLKFSIEQYRAHKFTKVTGLFHFMLVDPWPCISYSVIDYFRKKKPGYSALQSAFQPVLLIFHPEKAIFSIGDSIKGMFYLVNDYPCAFPRAKIIIRLGSFRYPAKVLTIPANCRIIANKIIYPLPLPKKLKPGKHALSIEIYDRNHNFISSNNYTVTLKRSPTGLSPYSAHFNWVW